MTKQLLFSLALMLSSTFLTLNAQNWNEIINATASDAAASDYFGLSVSIDGDYAIVGAQYNDDVGTSSGSAYIFLRSGSTWIEQAKLTASDAASGDQFGSSVAINGDYAIVGAINNNNDAGSAYIFKRSGTNWAEQTQVIASDTSTDDNFGNSVAISGDYAIVGALGNDDGGDYSGSAYIFVRSGINWAEQTKLTASDADVDDEFGKSVAIDGEYAIVGAYGNSDAGYASGSAYIFKRSGTNWGEQEKLTASDAAGADLFGFSVSIEGNYAIVGAYYNDDAGSDSGSAYIFMRSGTNWAEQAKLTASDAAAGDYFGLSVSIDGDYALISARNNADSGFGSGSAYIFMRSGANWTEQEKLTASDAASNDYFGSSVALDGNYAIVGTYGNDDSGTDSGSAYFFELDNPGSEGGVNWNEIINATASDAASGDEFGVSISIEGDYAIVGARLSDDVGTNSGSAYIFTRSGGSWTEQEKLTASDAAVGDGFGLSVSIDGNYAIVGAQGNDDAGSESGSAYIFVRSGNSWAEQAKLTASDAAAGDGFGRSVSIDGGYAIVGVYNSRDNDNNVIESGSAFVFIRSGSSWIEQAKLTASDAASYDKFGSSVAIDGDYAIIGANFKDDNSIGPEVGSAYIFKRSGTNWTEQAKLTASNAGSGDYFGSSVAIDGDYVIVGAHYNATSGSAYIFVRSGSSWTEQAKLTASDAASFDLFGISVSITGDHVIVGADGNDDAGSVSGSAYIFMRSGSNWIEQVKLTASDAATQDWFGNSVAINGNNAFVGAYRNSDSGSAYFFQKQTTYMFNNAWSPSNPNGIATATDDIIIAAGDATISSNTSANTVTINPGAGLSLDSGVTLTTSNGVALESNATSYSSVVGNGAISGTISYQRFVNSNILGNDLISPPLSGQTWSSFLDPVNATALLSNPGAPTAYAFAPFDKTTGNYENYDFNTVADLTSGTGYRAATNTGETLTFIGTIPATVTVNIIDATTAYSEWNLVGNPYPSYINVQAFLNHQVDSGVSNLNLFVDESAAIYGYDGNAQNGWTIYNIANTNASTVMAPGQGFFVAADASRVAAYDLEFTPDMQTTGTADDFIAGRDTELVYFKLGLSSNTNSYSTEFYFNANASVGFDRGYDAALWGTAIPEFSIYSHLLQDNLGFPIALQTINPTDLSEVSIPLGVHANQGEQISFSITESTLPESVNVYLDDVVTNISTLLNNSDYIITPNTNLTGTGRFFLRTTDNALSIIENGLDSINIFYLNSSKELVINGQIQNNTTIEIFDIQGRKILSSQLDSSVIENRINVSSYSGGVYLVNLKNNSQQKSKKIIIY